MVFCHREFSVNIDLLRPQSKSVRQNSRNEDKGRNRNWVSARALCTSLKTCGDLSDMSDIVSKIKLGNEYTKEEQRS
jgi:hypothetical protein